MKFEGKTVWLTGASSGIGAALAVEMSRRGATLILSARREDRLHEVRNRCARSDTHRVLPLDLAAPDTFAAAVKSAEAHTGQVDVLVNNGGISQRAAVAEIEMAIVRRIMEVNFFAAVGLTHALLPAMLGRGHGHIVVVSSLVGKISTPRRSVYAASKHALHGFFDALRAEVHDQGVRVTVVCPGYIRTEISEQALTADGTPHAKMDDGQANGMDPRMCARALATAVERERAEVTIGGPETWAVTLKRFLPAVYRRAIRRAKIT